MINLSNSILSKAIIHKIGNSYNQVPNNYSESVIRLTDSEYHILYPESFSFFEAPREIYHFHHSADLGLNEVYNYSKKIFENDAEFIAATKNLASHLLEQTIAPSIHTGDLIIALLEEIEFEDVITDAIAIVKCENQSAFFRTSKNKSNYLAELCSGINLKKYDKACLVVNVKDENGFRVICLDKNDNTNYWKRDFLNVEICTNDYYKTKEYLSLTQEFVDKISNTGLLTSKSDKAAILNETINYFKGNLEFEEKTFLKNVFKEKGIIKSFENFKNEFQDANNLNIESSFDISTDAVKKQARYFRKVIKLDRNFHLYVHGNPQLIEKGYDSEKSLNYYKVYFKEEN